MTAPRSILIIGPAHPLRGGLAVYNERLAQQFRQEGWDVTVYTFSLQYPGFLFPGVSQYDDRPAPDGLDIFVKINSINPLNWLKVGREIARRSPDVVLFRFWIPLMAPCFGTIARLVRRNGHTRVVAITDNIVPHEKRPGDRILTRYFLSSIHGAVTMSQKVREDLRAVRPSLPSRYQPHPLYDNFGDPVPREEACAHTGIPSEGINLLFFGFIREYKGLDWLLEAFADERLRACPVRLIVAGECYGDMRPYQELTDRYGLGDRVLLHNRFIADQDVRYYFCAADLVVQPYKHATQSGVTQICYHFCRPMLVTRVGGLAEMIPDGKVGYAVEPQVPAIADALVDFCLHRHRNDFDAGILEEKRKYRWSGMTEAIAEVAFHGREA